MTDKPVPRTVEEYLEQAWGHIDEPDKWLRGRLHSDDLSRHCSIGALEQVVTDHKHLPAPELSRLQKLHKLAIARLALLPGQKRPISIMNWNDSQATFATLKSRWMKAMGRKPVPVKTASRPDDAPPITDPAEAARSLRARLGFPRHLETMSVKEHDLSISGD